MWMTYPFSGLRLSILGVADVFGTTLVGCLMPCQDLMVCIHRGKFTTSSLSHV